jgi:hypothetical protein
MPCFSSSMHVLGTLAIHDEIDELPMEPVANLKNPCLPRWQSISSVQVFPSRMITTLATRRQSPPLVISADKKPSKCVSTLPRASAVILPQTFTGDNSWISGWIVTSPIDAPVPEVQPTADILNIVFSPKVQSSTIRCKRKLELLFLASLRC